MTLTKITTFFVLVTVLCGVFISSRETLSNPAFNTVVISVGPKKKQIFQGFGFSQPSGSMQKWGTAAQRKKLKKIIFEDLKTNTLRLWYRNQHSKERAQSEFIRDYVKSGLVSDAGSHGVTNFLLAPSGLKKFNAQELDEVAAFIKELKDNYNITVTTTGVANEPGNFTPNEIVKSVLHLRKRLDSLNLRNVNIIAPESASADGNGLEQVKALKANNQAWDSIQGIASHSYNMAATMSWAAQVEGTNKEYWQTEAGAVFDNYSSSVTSASRLLNDLNHHVDHWVWFIGSMYQKKNSNTPNNHRLVALSDDPARMHVTPDYYYLYHVLNSFDRGAVMRKSLSNKGGATSRAGNMTFTYGHKPDINAAVGQNPDGSWTIGITNNTGVEWPARFNKLTRFSKPISYDAIVQINELVSADKTDFTLYRTTESLQKKMAKECTVSMVNGRIKVRIGPKELVTLRSTISGSY